MSVGIDREGAMKKAFEFIYKSETFGSYIEFGVFKGTSLVRAIKWNLNWQNKTNCKYINEYFGFDSFKGLPLIDHLDHLDGYEVFYTGQFSDTNLENVYSILRKDKLPTENVTLIPGFYSDSLICEETLGLVGQTRAAIVHIDCDLYSSAKECLHFLTGKLADGAVMLFDDWFCYRGRPDRGVHKAFNEWCQSAPYWVSDYFNYSWAGRAFIINIKE